MFNELTWPDSFQKEEKIKINFRASEKRWDGSLISSSFSILFYLLESFFFFLGEFNAPYESIMACEQMVAIFEN